MSQEHPYKVDSAEVLTPRQIELLKFLDDAEFAWDAEVDVIEAGEGKEPLTELEKIKIIDQKVNTTKSNDGNKRFIIDDSDREFIRKVLIDHIIHGKEYPRY